ncbi:hypothetical protein M427DRAFT_151215 [Gonapodya prolifera JEL478]|uniref:Uncharacterized protein n=1 Tax=Gonapodya prolifera (strain JEL478) TaxID=1344416 RepID=A0A139AZ31_GONPJ|nr:hypothetical protein M427DRAFT_151215 [Gonapodya prolifera JEL478]|eukprot:KXS21991.1 hypothetical protein M427DRAFT_151215 [Gonapodya prolifera JEL478]
MASRRHVSKTSVSQPPRRSLEHLGLVFGVAAVIGGLLWLYTRQVPGRNKDDRSSSPPRTSSDPPNTSRSSNSRVIGERGTRGLRTRGVRKPKLTLNVNGITWNVHGGKIEPLQANMTELVTLLSSDEYNIFLIAEVNSDEEEAITRQYVLNSDLVTAGFDGRQLVFCNSEEGRFHVVRHINPAVHVDTSAALLDRLSGHVSTVLQGLTTLV